MNARTDIHRPGAIIPADYSYVGSYDRGSADDEGYCDDEVQEALAAIAPNGAMPIEGDEDGVKWGTWGQCGVCSTRFRMGAVFRHVPTGDLIHMGHTCASKYLQLAAFSECMMDRKRLEDMRATRLVRMRNEAKRAAFLAQHPGLAELLETDHYIIKDIKARFTQWCEVSEKQIALVQKIVRERDEKAAQPAEVHVPAPEGRLEVTGVVVSTKVVDSDFGSTLKMTVKVTTPEGTWLAWGTVPSSIEGEQLKGCTVRFTGTLARGRDSHFAFFKRPTNAEVIQPAKA